MADKKPQSATEPTKPGAGTDGEAPPISEATDGGSSRLHKGYKDNPDAPADAIAQVEELKE